MPYVKTALAAEALRHRQTIALQQRQRAALILFDGKRSVEEVLKQTSGLGVRPDDIAYLLDNGLLHEEKQESASKTEASATPSPSAPAIPPSPPVEPKGPNTQDLTVDEQQHRYRTAYPLATQLTATLGLRGFKLNLAVERAEGYAGLRELLPKIEAAVGPERAADLRKALDGAAR